MYLYMFLVIAFTIVISLLYIPSFLKLLEESGCIRENYKAKRIPSIGGVVYIPIVLSAIVFLIFNDMIQYQEYIRYVAIISVMAIIGLLDDLIGVKNIKGLKNHITAFFKGRLTTGFIKAFIGSLLALIISYILSSTVLEGILNFFIVILFTNTLNLLDVRPGRSTKVFVVLSVMLISLNLSQLYRILPFIIFTVAACIYLYYDLTEKCMLGDVGSNVYGITLGYYSVQLMDARWKLAFLVLLLGINMLAEKKSLTEIIHKNKLLSFFDNLGRGISSK